MSNELTKHNSNTAVMSISDMEAAAEMMAGSGLFPSWDTKEKVMTLMLLSRAEGCDPVTAVNRYENIQGRVSKKPNAMLADFISAGGKVEWIKSTNDIAEGKFTTPHGVEHVEQFTIEDARRAELAGKGNWKKYPKAMLKARCISAALRAVFPSATNLMHTTDELQYADTNDNKKPKTVPVTIHRAESSDVPEMGTKEPEMGNNGEIKVQNTADDVQDDSAVKWDELMQTIDEHEMILFCQSRGMLNKGQNMADMSEKNRAAILANVGRFTSKVAEFVTKLKEEKTDAAD
jgi:hypothetical protein